MSGMAGDAAYQGRREPEAVDEAVIELVESLEPHPAYVVGARWDVLHANRAARLLFADWGGRPPHERNMLWYYLCDPAARALYADWEGEARAQLRNFRDDYERWPQDPSFDALLEQVFATTPQARTWWYEAAGTPRRSGLKQVRFGDGRPFALRQLALATVDDPEVQVLCYFADVDDDGDFGDDVEELLDEA